MSSTPRRRLLIIAFHFPPLQLSSGVHRTLSLARYLPDDGWDVSVLTVNPELYRRCSSENLSLIPENTRVIRARAFDTSRQLSIRGWYPRMLAVPDNYSSWILSGLRAGLRHCRRQRPDVILSTYPIASAHCLGRLLSRATGIPLVVDFRDPMAQEDYPPDRRLRRALFKLERRCVERAALTFVTTPGAHRLYTRRYPELPQERFHVVPNGYDPAIFSRLEHSGEHGGDRVTLVHSGSLYRSERDPTEFFAALAEMKAEDPVGAERLQVLFRGTRYTSYFQEIVDRFGIASVITFGEPITYQAAVAEMSSADGLLVLQGADCNDQIPAKVYEYMKARRPILALVDPEGDTGRLLQSCGVVSTARLDDRHGIKNLLQKFLRGDSRGCEVDDNYDVEQFSRERIARMVSAKLSALTAS